MADEIVLSYHDSLLRKSDLALLKEGCWLNDRVIGFMFDYFKHGQFNDISDDVLFITPDVTQFLKLGQGPEVSIFIKPLNLPSHKVVFFAVNDNNTRVLAGGSHWSLLMYSKQDNSFHHYDSLSPHNYNTAKSLAGNIEPFLEAGTRSSFVEDSCPLQENSYDCGVYVINVTEHLCSSFSGETQQSFSECVTPKDVTRKRKYLKELILELAQKTSHKQLEGVS